MHTCLPICMPAYVCLYLRTYACMYACMHVCMHVRVHECMSVCTYACMHVCMHVWMYVRLHGCMVASMLRKQSIKVSSTNLGRSCCERLVTKSDLSRDGSFQQQCQLKSSIVYGCLIVHDCPVQYCLLVITYVQ